MEHHQNTVAVVIVPLPAQGHLNQLLHLARILSIRDISVHYIGATTHNRQAKERAQGWDPSAIPNLHFHDFQLPHFITPPPDPYDTNKFPKHLVDTFDKAAVHLRQHLGLLLRRLSSSNGRVVVVHDRLMSFAAHEASFVSNAEAYCFGACSAFSILHFVWEALGKPLDEEGNILPKDIPRITFEGSFSDGFSEFAAQSLHWMDCCSGDIYNTCDAIDGRFVNLLSRHHVDKKYWAIGPFNPLVFNSSGKTPHKCFEWLDKQPPNSVIYVSFGTMTSISDDQVTELAIGLEKSGQKFIWVLRDADRGNIYTEEVREPPLPDGFEERVKGVGLIIRDWAPQVQILAHSSTGGFMSHCGWNSTMESLSMGIPIAAWPMHSDQPRNALLITQVLKVGLMVREWTSRKEVVSSKIIESSVRQLMVSDDGNLMRKRANELGVKVREAVSDGGSSATQLESFIAHISRQ